MARKRRRSSKELINYTAKLVILLGLLAYAPIVAWWQSIPPVSRVLLIATPAFVITVGACAVIIFSVNRKRERTRAWQEAMLGWQNNVQSNLIAEKQSA